ncbi:unnamed protein product [Clavelina lepadiformis]|uniref:Uncharacterized protein n=1 Tax=Clavelina lepadiformis TaxID=159417 RepID=A0ABP0FSG2_CLALP
MFSTKREPNISRLFKAEGKKEERVDAGKENTNTRARNKNCTCNKADRKRKLGVSNLSLPEITVRFNGGRHESQNKTKQQRKTNHNNAEHSNHVNQPVWSSSSFIGRLFVPVRVPKSYTLRLKLVPQLRVVYPYPNNFIILFPQHPHVGGNVQQNPYLKPQHNMTFQVFSGVGPTSVTSQGNSSRSGQAAVVGTTLRRDNERQSSSSHDDEWRQYLVKQTTATPSKNCQNPYHGSSMCTTSGRYI